MNTLKIQGKELTSKKEREQLSLIERDDLTLSQIIDVSTLRAGNHSISINIKKDDDIVNIEFEDGAEWIGSAFDFTEIFGEKILNKRGGDRGIELPSTLSGGGDRGLKEIGIKFISLFTRKEAAAEIVAEEIGELFDQHSMPNPGLYRLGQNLQLHEYQSTLGQEQSFLLLIHGTASSTEGSFGSLNKEDKTGVWDTLHKAYKNNILALEHRTVSISPIQNAIDVLEVLPSHCTLDIISHSRGGIVADILARCDKRNDHPGFTNQEMDKIKKEDNNSLKLMEDLNDLVIKKAISVNKVIRVACPAQGTILLSERLDHFLNGLLRAIGLAFGGPENPLYQRVRSFIVDVIKAKAEPDIMPGLNAMIPDSPFQQVINNPHVLVKSHLAVIEGNSEVGSSIKQSILVVFAKLFYWVANDFVVNTQSMRYGARRENGYHLFLSQDSKTSHFNYFKNQNSQQAIQDAINAKAGEKTINGFTYNRPQCDSRGIALRLIDMGEVVRDQISGSKPIVILLPGIMGSNLEVNGEKIWLDFEKIKDGKIKTQLYADKKRVKANSLIGKFYQDFILELLKHYDVHTFAYDWRLSLQAPASKLNDLIKQYRKDFNQPIKLIAHSMGGLVVRQMMLDHSDDWKTYINQPDSQFIMLGTPWLGSYLIMEVLTGYSKRIKKLAFLDFKNSHHELLEVFVKYAGIFELLPIDQRNFENQAFWTQLDKELGEHEFPVPNDKELEHFKAYKDKVENEIFDFSNVYYIAGKKNATVANYVIKESWFSKKIRFINTPDGDGSVTWDSGIPNNFPTENLYFTNTEHGELANDPRLFDGIIELLKEGTTSHFQKTRPVSRTMVHTSIFKDDLVSNDPLESADILFGIGGDAMTYEKQVDELEVTVTHAHLKVSQYPLMVGHFKQDGIVSAESALDRKFEGKLSERHLVGKYPGDIGESEVLVIAGNKPVGAVVIGLGDSTQLTSYKLTKSIELGIINYAMHLRDSCDIVDKNKFSDGISSLCIGSAYGGLPMENALSAILNGINRANVRLKELNSGLQIIKKVEFIELYEHVARKAYFSLKRIQKSRSELRITVQGFNTRYGAKQKLEYTQDSSWWHDFITEFANNMDKTDKPRLVFKSSSGLARVEMETLFPAQPVVEALLKELSTKSDWNEELSKTLFEILIPNEFKEIVRTQTNILWKLDVETASYPWEMFHDSGSDKDPTFVNAGLIRQLTSESYRTEPKMIRTNKALVIGDPIYTHMSLPQLPAAKIETENVTEKLRQENFQVEALIGEQGVNIINSIFNAEYKILHVAGHGIFNPEENQIGAALGNGMFLSPELIKSLSKVPEFVFINCCYSGTMDSAYEKYYQDRYKLAANLGTQLINMGVNAAVITGWAVDDGAAELFANILYKKMLDGYYFGEAVQLARKKCYEQFKQTNTWGAYQCYGNPWYKLVKKSPESSEGEEYISEQQVVVDLSNILSWSENCNHQDIEPIRCELESIIKQAKRDQQYDGSVIEKEAEIYASIDELGVAVDRYQILLHLNKATFSVKSLEQFCNLRAKLLVKNQINDEPIIKKLLSDLDTLILIGKTPERLCILGNAYKCIAQLTVKGESNTHLKKMADYYQQAYELSQSNLNDSVYPLTNWLTSLKLTDQKMEFNGKTCSEMEFLIKIEKELESKITFYENFGNDINLVNLIMCKMLFTTSVEEINLLKNKIIFRYKDAWEIGGNYKHARTEIEHIEFIQTIWGTEGSSTEQKIVKALGEVKNELEGLMHCN